MRGGHGRGGVSADLVADGDTGEYDAYEDDGDYGRRSGEKDVLCKLERGEGYGLDMACDISGLRIDRVLNDAAVQAVIPVT